MDLPLGQGPLDETFGPSPRRILTRSPSSALLPFFAWEGSPTKIDYRKKGTLILSSLLEDLAERALDRILKEQPNHK